MSITIPETNIEASPPAISKLQQQLKEIILEIGTIKKRPLKEGEKIEDIWNISANDVENKGEIFYMNPCIAQNLYYIKKLKETGMYKPEDIFLGIEFFVYEDGRPSFHFFTTTQQDNNIYITDFSHDNYVFSYK
jgi:hypothetical protein